MPQAQRPVHSPWSPPATSFGATSWFNQAWTDPNGRFIIERAHTESCFAMWAAPLEGKSLVQARAAALHIPIPQAMREPTHVALRLLWPIALLARATEGIGTPVGQLCSAWAETLAQELGTLDTFNVSAIASETIASETWALCINPYGSSDSVCWARVVKSLLGWAGPLAYSGVNPGYSRRRVYGHPEPFLDLIDLTAQATGSRSWVSMP